jgi:hypothetical protein
MKRILIISIACLFFAGCSTGTGAFAGGAATGAALSQTFAGAKADLDAKQKALLAEQAAIVAKLEASNDDAEKTMLEAQNAALKKKLELVATAQAGIETAEKAVKTDWTDLNQTSPWIVSAIMAGLTVLTQKKKTSVSNLLKAVNEGVEKYKAQAQPADAQKLYEAVKERKAKSGILS